MVNTKLYYLLKILRILRIYKSYKINNILTRYSILRKYAHITNILYY